MSEPVVPERYKQEHKDLSSPPVPSATWEWDTARHKAMGQFAKKLIGELGAAEAKVAEQATTIKRLKAELWIVRFCQSGSVEMADAALNPQPSQPDFTSESMVQPKEKP